MVKAIFRNFVLAAAGPNEHTLEQLQSWTALRKGRFAADMNDSVTHLLCTDEQYTKRRRNERIKTAKIRGKKVVRIVHVDWFTFSCTHNKKLKEANYNFNYINEQERLAKKKQLDIERRIRNFSIGETWINPDVFHVFQDRYQFRYEVHLFKTVNNEDETIQNRYDLHLFESYATPRLYWFGVKLFQKTDDGVWRFRAVERTSSAPGSFHREYMRFKNFFLLKTGIHWLDRVLRAELREKQDKFAYYPPTGGKPTGTHFRDGLTYDECAHHNRKLRVLYAELFDEQLPDRIFDAEIDEVLEGIIDEACASLEYDEVIEGIVI
ncbi:hypothetical protein C8034_v011214 [Colletotrichum sidae]|uniref:BRCT domain-containing protein n=1 Tax=Colletotrichum sidae TaxID=1347389 RepID=A0A4R8TIK9_9PEZI|nr:hypothetical protein C8034_v011214 [Colletotrichum sidae]